MDLCPLQVSGRFVGRQVRQFTVQFSSARTMRLQTGDGKGPPIKAKDMSQEVGWQHCAIPVTKTTPPLSNTLIASSRPSLSRPRLRRVPVPPWRSCVCRSDHQLPFVKQTPSRRAAARGRTWCRTPALPFPEHLFARLSAGSRRRAVVCAFLFELSECDVGFTILGAFSSSGYLDVSRAASDLPFTYQRILHSPNCSIAQTR